MQVDEVISKLNRKPFFKIIAFLILSFPSYQNYGQIQSILLAVITPNYTCQFPDPGPNFSVSNDQCSLNVSGSIQTCSKWNYSDAPVGTTMTSDYDLICDKKNYGDYILIVWYASSFSSFLMGWLSDKYGRKKITILNLTIETVFSILLAFSPNVASNIFFRFFIGVSASGTYVSFVWLLESVDVQFKEITGSFFWAYGCIAYMVFPLIVSATKNWRHTQLISIIPSVFYIFIFLIPESPRWLFVSGHRKEAFVSLKKISRINKLQIEFEKMDIVVTKEEESGGLMAAVKSPEFLFRTALTFLLQFSTYLLYYGVTVNISILSKDVLLSIFLLGLMEIPGLFLSYICLHYMKRKVCILFLGVIGSTLFWVSVFFHRGILWQSMIRIILGCVGKAMVSSVNQISMVYVAELFPTSHRSFSFVCIQMSNFLSFVAAIYVNKLKNVFFIIPMTIYVFFMWISCGATYCLLPETKGMPFPETLEDQMMLKLGHEEEFLEYMENKGKKEMEDDSDASSPLIRKNSI